jgi:hypothetical protein
MRFDRCRSSREAVPPSSFKWLGIKLKQVGNSRARQIHFEIAAPLSVALDIRKPV